LKGLNNFELFKIRRGTRSVLINILKNDFPMIQNKLVVTENPFAGNLLSLQFFQDPVAEGVPSFSPEFVITGGCNEDHPFMLALSPCE
jgi:hypothetical protein